MLQSTGALYAVTVALCLFYCVVTINQIYGAICLYKNRDKISIIKRCQFLTICFHTALSITLILCGISTVTALYLSVISATVVYTVFISTIGSILITLYFANVRNWIIFYNIIGGRD